MRTSTEYCLPSAVEMIVCPTSLNVVIKCFPYDMNVNHDTVVSKQPHLYQ